MTTIGEPCLFRSSDERCNRCTPGRLRLRPVEQLGPAFLLRTVRVLDLQPPDACVVGIETLRHDTFEIVGTHQLEEFAPPALDGERLGNDRRPLRNNAPGALSTLGERQSAQVGAVEPEISKAT